MSKKELYIKARDAINKLMGKHKLIEEYNKTLLALSEKADSLRGKPERARLVKELRQISEEKIIGQSEPFTAFTIDSFNPYSVTTSKSKLKTKLAMLNKLKQEYFKNK